MLEHVFNRDMLRDLERMIDDRVERKLAEHQLNEWMPVEEAAKMLGCTTVALRDRIRRGVVPASRMSRRLYVKRSDIYNELERKRG